MKIPKEQLKTLLKRMGFTLSLKKIISFELRIIAYTKDNKSHVAAVRFLADAIDPNSYILNRFDEARFKNLSIAKIDAETLKSQLKIIYKSAHDYCVRIESKELWDELVNSVNEKLNKGSDARDLEDSSSLLVAALSGSGYHAHLIPVVSAVAFYFQAKKTLRRGDLPGAAHYVERGIYWSSDDLQMQDPHQIFIKRARIGGNARAEIYFESVKDEVVKLLNSIAPAEGWIYAVDAVDALRDPIWEFINCQKPGGEPRRLNFSYSNLNSTLQSWIREDPRVKSAYQKHRKKN